MLTKLVGYCDLKYDNYHSQRLKLNLIKIYLQLFIIILNYWD
jgi:hypothetical protein